MNEYEYIFNDQSLEIFPERIVNDPYIVFHGTSHYYSEHIEQIGFQRNYSPFDENAVVNLVELLESENFINYDVDNMASSLRHYLNNNMRLSFTSLSGNAINYATGISKGGQIIGKIRRAQQVVNNALSENPELDNNINELIRNLFILCSDIGNALGVIYAIRLPADLNGIIDENYVIHSYNSIPAISIEGRVILPNGIEEVDRETVSNRNKQKIIDGIGKILYRKNEEE